jgi:hypothetical protein
MYQYRITVNNTVGAVVSTPMFAEWARAAEACEERGMPARLERRLVTDLDILDFFGGDMPAGWMRLGARIVTNWEVFAEISQ